MNIYQGRRYLINIYHTTKRRQRKENTALKLLDNQMNRFINPTRIFLPYDNVFFRPKHIASQMRFVEQVPLIAT